MLETYENPAYGLEISYPSEWQQFEINQNNMIVGFVSYPQNESRILDGVIIDIVDPLYHNYSLQSIAGKEYLMYKSQLDNFKFISSSSSITPLPFQYRAVY